MLNKYKIIILNETKNLFMKNRITYVFVKGRKEKYLSKSYEATDFFYGLTSFDSINNIINIIEFDNETTLFRKLVYYVDRFFNKFISLPFYMHRILSLKNLNTLIKTDNLVLVNESTAFSLLPFLLILKLFFKTNITLFVMGMYSKKIHYPIFYLIHKLLINLVNFCVDNVLFLGKGEFEYAKKSTNKILNFHYFPFAVDTNFWENDDSPKKNQILFIGNDGNKNFELVKQIAQNLQNLSIIIVTNSNIFDDFQERSNVKIFKGEWGSNKITDSQLKQFYSESIVTILPLRNSVQPSGQSVALQSMSIGTPVLISKTEGFWDKDNFIDQEDIFFIDDDDYKSWLKKIYILTSSKPMLEKVSLNSKAKVRDKLNEQVFFTNLLKYIT